MAQIKPSLELYHWSTDEPHSYNHLDFTGFWKKPKNGPKIARKRFFGHISGTESPRTKIFALLGSSYMTGPWGNIKILGALGAFVDFKKHAILKEEHISTAGSKNKNKKPVFTKVALLKKFSGEKTFSIFALCCVVEWWFWKRKMQAIKWQMFGQCQIKCWQQVFRQFKHCCCGPIVIIMALSFIISGKPTKSHKTFCCWTWKKIK